MERQSTIPPTRCSDGISDSNMLISKTTTCGEDAYIESLPDELLFDILVRLPADFLHDRARLVCRRWCHIIRSNAFASTHIQQYSSTYGLVLKMLRSNRRPRSFYVTATQGRIETSEMSNIRNASCNGLALDINASGELHVINPLTKQSFLLPSVSTHDKRHVFYRLSGIAYSAASMEYKVTLPYNTVDDGHVQYCLDIVTVGVDKSWRHVEIPPLLEHVRSLFYLFPLSSEGFLHWAKGRYCLTMNVETEIITMSEVPIPQRNSYEYLSTGRYLSLLVGCGKFSWEVWEMKLPAESGDQWRKAVLPNIDLEPKKHRLLHERSHPVGWVKYPEVLAFCFSGIEQTCKSYNLETHEIDTIELPHHPWVFFRAIVHRNTLAWLSQK